MKRQAGDHWKLPPFTVQALVSAQDLGEKIPWSLEKYDVPSVWATTKGDGITWAVIDTGVDVIHAERGDLAGQIIEALDFTGSRSGWEDKQGHGSHVASTIAAKQGNSTDFAGVAPLVKLCCYKALGDDGYGRDAWIVKAIERAIERKCHGINMSLGAPQPSRLIRDAIHYASKYLRVVCAAGNSGGPLEFPGGFPEVVAVGATDREGNIAQFSCRGPSLDCAAPGVDIPSLWINGGGSIISGTSMAAPFASGCIALALSAQLKATGKVSTPNIKDDLALIAKTARDAGKPGQDDEYGFGIIDAGKLVDHFKPVVDSTGNSTTIDLRIAELHIPALATDYFSIGPKK